MFMRVPQGSTFDIFKPYQFIQISLNKYKTYETQLIKKYSYEVVCNEDLT
jgi:hypothetical protein